MSLKIPLLLALALFVFPQVSRADLLVKDGQNTALKGSGRGGKAAIASAKIPCPKTASKVADSR